MRSQRRQSRWRLLGVPAAALATLLVGCSLPGKDKSQAGLLESLKPTVTTAGYQEQVVEEGPPKKIKDPLTLKLRYAKWMEEIENYHEAQANYNLVLQKRPEEIEAILGLARIDQVADRLDAAEVGFQKALSLKPDSVIAKNAMGQFYVSQNRLPEALPLLSEAMLGDPTNKLYRFHLAVALAKLGDTNAALPHFKESVGEVAAYYNVGMVLKSQGQYRQAEQYFMQVLARNPDFDAAKQAVGEVRQLAQSSQTYAQQSQTRPQITPAGHSRPSPLSPAQQEQLRNQRSLRR